MPEGVLDLPRLRTVGRTKVVSKPEDKVDGGRGGSPDADAGPVLAELTLLELRRAKFFLGLMIANDPRHAASARR